MATSSIPAFLVAYLAAVRGAVPAGTQVFFVDGVTDADADLVIYIGADDPDPGVGYFPTVRNASQQWATTGKTRDERYDVPGVVVVRNGDDDMVAAMNAAFAVVANIETVLLADPAVADTVLYVLVEVTETESVFTGEGAVHRVHFQVKVRARI